jgi:hypothetical protein
MNSLKFKFLNIDSKDKEKRNAFSNSKKYFLIKICNNIIKKVNIPKIKLFLLNFFSKIKIINKKKA